MWHWTAGRSLKNVRKETDITPQRSRLIELPMGTHLCQKEKISILKVFYVLCRQHNIKILASSLLILGTMPHKRQKKMLTLTLNFVNRYLLKTLTTVTTTNGEKKLVWVMYYFSLTFRPLTDYISCHRGKGFMSWTYHCDEEDADMMTVGFHKC